jgi:hypothetical protein
VGAAFTIGVSSLESWGGRPRASAPPTESAPTNIANHIDGQLCTAKRPVIEAIALSNRIEFGLKMPYLSLLRLCWSQQHPHLPDAR